MTDQVLNLGTDAGAEKTFVSRATDPVVSNVGTPIDFAAQYPTPLNTEELISMCEEISTWRGLPEKRTSLREETWRELNELAFTSGSSYISFADGSCPEEYYHDGDNQTVTTKWIGAKKSLTVSDIMHSAAVAAADWNGINQLVGGFGSGQGLPGEFGQGTFMNQMVGDLKAKEMVLASTLVMNGWDKMLISGNKQSNALEFDGLETLITSGNGARTSTVEASGTFTAANFDRFLSEGCATPTDLFGHPQAIQELMQAYMQLTWQGSQQIRYVDNNRLVPGFNFASEVNTGVGTLKLHADRNFTKTVSGSNQFQSKIYALRMNHNGMPLVYKLSQIPLSFKDLVPGCTSISFQISSRTALVVKAACSQGYYLANFGGRTVTTCPTI
jgi:hypothetical protein